MSIERVALLGADGKLGPHVLSALCRKNFEVTVLKRDSSKSKDEYPEHVQVKRIPNDFDVDTVAKAVSGHDAVVVTVKGSQTDLQDKLAQACVRGGVRRFIPADFGSCDSSSQRAQDLVPLFKRKTELRERLIRLATDNANFTWTSLVCGHFFDWDPAFLHIWVEERKADVLDDGEAKWSASTMSRIAEATVQILMNSERTKNQVLYIQSFCVSQNQVIKSFERATESQWQIRKYDSKAYESDEKAKADDGDLDAVENLVWLLGTLDNANWETRENFAMRTLVLANEDLDAAVQKIVQDSG